MIETGRQVGIEKDPQGEALIKVAGKEWPLIITNTNKYGDSMPSVTLNSDVKSKDKLVQMCLDIKKYLHIDLGLVVPLAQDAIGLLSEIDRLFPNDDAVNINVMGKDQVLIQDSEMILTAFEDYKKDDERTLDSPDMGESIRKEMVPTGSEGGVVFRGGGEAHRASRQATSEALADLISELKDEKQTYLSELIAPPGVYKDVQKSIKRSISTRMGNYIWGGKLGSHMLDQIFDTVNKTFNLGVYKGPLPFSINTEALTEGHTKKSSVLSVLKQLGQKYLSSTHGKLKKSDPLYLKVINKLSTQFPSMPKDKVTDMAIGDAMASNFAAVDTTSGLGAAIVTMFGIYKDYFIMLQKDYFEERKNNPSKPALSCEAPSKAVTAALAFMVSTIMTQRKVVGKEGYRIEKKKVSGKPRYVIPKDGSIILALLTAMRRTIGTDPMNLFSANRDIVNNLAFGGMLDQKNLNARRCLGFGIADRTGREMSVEMFENSDGVEFDPHADWPQATGVTASWNTRARLIPKGETSK